MPCCKDANEKMGGRFTRGGGVAQSSNLLWRARSNQGRGCGGAGRGGRLWGEVEKINQGRRASSTSGWCCCCCCKLLEAESKSVACGAVPLQRWGLEAAGGEKGRGEAGGEPRRERGRGRRARRFAAAGDGPSAAASDARRQLGSAKHRHRMPDCRLISSLFWRASLRGVSGKAKEGGDGAQKRRDGAATKKTNAQGGFRGGCAAGRRKGWKLARNGTKLCGIETGLAGRLFSFRPLEPVKDATTRLWGRRPPPPPPIS